MFTEIQEIKKEIRRVSPPFAQQHVPFKLLVEARCQGHSWKQRTDMTKKNTTYYAHRGRHSLFPSEISRTFSPRLASSGSCLITPLEPLQQRLCQDLFLVHLKLHVRNAPWLNVDN